MSWSAACRAAAALSADPPRAVPAAPADLVVEAAIREKTAAIVARHLDHPRLKAVADSVLARQVLALTQAREVLSRLGPEVIPLKGLHLLETHYRPGERDLGDLDLLVPRSRVGAADAALRAMGFKPVVEAARILEAGGGFLNAALYQKDGAFPVHLHWHVVNASLPLFMMAIRAEEIWSESAAGVVAGARARRMAPHHLLVTICEHALKHSYDALIHLADIDRVWRAGVDSAEAQRTARRWRVGNALSLGVHLAREILGTPADLRPPSGALARWIVGCVRADRRWAGLGAMGYLSMARGWRERLRFVRASLAPPPREVEAFGKRPGWGSLARRARAAVRTVLGALT